MANSMVVKVTCMAVMFMVLGFPFADAALSCGQVLPTVLPCLGYLRNPGPSVPEPCCNGVRNLNNEAKTTPDRRAVCSCFKSAISSFPGLSLPALASLPANCGVNLPFKPSPTIDCNKIN